MGNFRCLYFQFELNNLSYCDLIKRDIYLCSFGDPGLWYLHQYRRESWLTNSRIPPLQSWAVPPSCYLIETLWGAQKPSPSSWLQHNAHSYSLPISKLETKSLSTFCLWNKGKVSCKAFTWPYSHPMSELLRYFHCLDRNSL